MPPGNRTVCITTLSVPGQLRMLQSARASQTLTSAPQTGPVRCVANRMIGPPCLLPRRQLGQDQILQDALCRALWSGCSGWASSSQAAGGCTETSPADDGQRQKARMLPEGHRRLILQLLVVSWPRGKTAVSLHREKVGGHCGKSLPLSVIHSLNVVHRI